METFIALLFILGIAIAFSWWCGSISREKGHGFAVGFVLGLVLGMLGLIIVLVMSPTKDAGSSRRRVRRPGSNSRGTARPVSRLSTISVSGPTSTATMPSVSGTVSRPASRTKRLVARPKLRR